MSDRQRHVVPLVLDTRFFRPLPKSMFGANCHCCDKPQSRWEMGPPHGGEVYTVCSLCFLYESKWGEKRADQIHVLVDEVEAAAGEKFLRAADGHTLISCKDADRILAAIALTSRMFQMQDSLAGAKEQAAATREGDGDAKRES